MDIKKPDFSALAAKALRFWIEKDAKYIRSHRHPIPEIRRGEFVKAEGEGGELFTAGFMKVKMMPGDIREKKYYISGYGENNPATGILDDLYASALWLDDGTGKGGILLVSLDATGILSNDVNRIRTSLSRFCKKTGCRSVNIMCIHDHAAIDTMGIWGALPKTGKNAGFMKTVRDAVVAAAEGAYSNRKQGNLYLGRVRVPELQEDIRLPEVYSDVLTRFRFVPNDGSKEIYLVNFAAHSESLGGSNSLISGDFPAYFRRRIAEKTGADAIYFVGAIGGMISIKADEHSMPDIIEHTMDIGRKLADICLTIKDERKLRAKIGVIRSDVIFEAENLVLMAAAKLSIIDVTEYDSRHGATGAYLKSELTYLEIDDVKCLLLPCELFPELAYGGYLTSETSAQGNSESINPLPLCEIADDPDMLIFGLANDEIGYVIPPNDFMLHPTAPYLDIPRDRLGRRHYEETNSVGPKTAAAIADTFQKMYAFACALK